jgi:hypothetical protein
MIEVSIASEWKLVIRKMDWNSQPLFFYLSPQGWRTGD